MQNQFDTNPNYYDYQYQQQQQQQTQQPTYHKTYQNNNPLYTKVYLGQLPLDISEQNLKEAFDPHCETDEIRIVKANAQGFFARYCYAFINIKGNENFSNDVIKKVISQHPNWKINIRADYQKIQNKSYNNQPQQRYQPQEQNNFQPQQHQGGFMQPMQPNFNNRLLGSYNEGEKGTKKNKILVREIWVGGIPQGISEQAMRSIMELFGIIQSLEIFSKFAFIKFKMVNDATTAFEKAAVIHEKFGRPPGFRIFFSDPQKRTNIVSNHYEYDRQSEYLPILFLGFPPITSSFVDEVYMKSICEKYGQVTQTYMRKSNNPQTRSYILMTYDNLKNALKAKQELSKRRDLLGDKRVQVALLLQQDAILKGRNLQNTVEKFQNSNNFEKRPQKPNPVYNPNTFQPMPNMFMQYPDNRNGFPGFNPNTRMPMPMGMNPMAMQNPMGMPYFPMPIMDSRMGGGYYYPQTEQPSQNQYQSEDVVKIIQSMLNKPKEVEAKLKQTYARGQQPCWSGFLIRNKNYRVGADGFAKTDNFNFDQSMINVSYLLKLSQLKLKAKKHILVLEPTNDISRKQFEEYIAYFLKKESAGVAIFYKEIIFLLPKCPQADQICNITDKQILVVMEDIGLYHEIKEKLEKVDDTSAL